MAGRRHPPPPGQEFGVRYSLSGVYKLLDRLDYKGLERNNL